MENSKSSSGVLEVTVISAERLQENQRQSVKKNTSVTIKADSCNGQTTRINKEGGSHPSWNEKLFLDLPMHVRYLNVEVQCKTLSGIKTIGIARVPMTDFMGGFLPEDYLHFLSYRLRDEKGEKNGIINLSVKIKNAGHSNGCAATYSNIWTGAPHTFSGGVVTGIPINYPSR